MGILRAVLVFLRAMFISKAHLAFENLALLSATTFCSFLREFSPFSRAVP